MPVTSQVGRVVWHHHDMERARGDGELAARAQVLLARLVGLHRGHGHVEKIAQPITARVAITASTTITMSVALRSWLRNGLKPMAGR